MRVAQACPNQSVKKAERSGLWSVDRALSRCWKEGDFVKHKREEKCREATLGSDASPDEVKCGCGPYMQLPLPRLGLHCKQNLQISEIIIFVSQSSPSLLL